MHDSFDPLRALYGEARPDGTVPARDDLSAAARAEHDALAPIQAALDAREREGPDAAVLAAVLDAARVNGQAPPARPARAADRAPVQASAQPRAVWRRTRVALPILALFACGAIGLALFVSQRPAVPGGLAEAPAAEAPLADTAPSAAEEARADDEVAEALPQAPLADATPRQATARPAAQAAASPSAAGRAAEPQAFEPSASADRAVVARERAAAPRAAVQPEAGLTLVADAPTWDTPGDEDLRLLSLRLQSLREANAGLAWDEPPVALSASGAGAVQSRALNLTSDTIHDEPRVGFHAVPQRAGWIRVQAGGR